MSLTSVGEDYPISKEYLTISERSSTVQKTKSYGLIILDLNGTLCSRTTVKSFYTRPHADTFFNYIFNNFTVMVWSSAQESSVKNMCKMFEPHKPTIVWHRGHLGLSAEDFYKDVEAVKDLDKVWEAYPQFSAKNTIVLDDTREKLAAQPYNLVLMRTFDHNSLGPTGERDLLKVIHYLMLAQVQRNYCNYIRYVPFEHTLDWCTVPNLVVDTHLNHFVNGRNINPAPEDVMKLLNVLPNPSDVSREVMEKEAKSLAKIKRKRNKKLVMKTQLQSNESTATRIMEPISTAQPTNTAQPIDTTQLLDPMPIIRSINVVQTTDDTQQADMQETEPSNIVSNTVDLLRGVFQKATDTMKTWRSNGNEEPDQSTSSLSDISMIEIDEEATNEASKIVSTTDNIEAIPEIIIPKVKSNYINESDMEGVEDVGLMEEILPNPFEAIYMQAFPSDTISPKHTPMRKVKKTDPPEKKNQSRAAKKSSNEDAKPHGDPVELLKTRPVKSILKSSKNFVPHVNKETLFNNETGSGTPPETLANLAEVLRLRKVKKMLRKANDGTI
ncbi:hypothetical protein INT47_001099 [Mucor saturninus]|uniref:Mitochondrial import inner membrane translocase subunit TIM50 n=1 Tax=Mucor saturninus TaxID=64648 RepID=A0A8H7VB12_9FUNG|nr:hypothetical protein INT47_001099 [Mucor saturninus]